MLLSITAAIRFLTRVPIPTMETKPEDISNAVAWFPCVGAVIGLLTAYIYSLTSNHWPPQISSILAISFSLMLTGGLHEDGATDAADGLCGGWTRDQVIEIMRDSRIGAYGTMLLWVLLTFRWVTLVTLDLKTVFIALPIAMAWSRWAIVVMMYLLPAISPGLASDIKQGMSETSVLLSSVAISVVTLTIHLIGFNYIWRSAIVAICTTIVWTAYLNRRIGGQTGDLLGAGSQLVEAAVLLSIMAT